MSLGACSPRRVARGVSLGANELYELNILFSAYAQAMLAQEFVVLTCRLCCVARGVSLGANELYELHTLFSAYAQAMLAQEFVVLTCRLCCVARGVSLEACRSGRTNYTS